MQISFIATVVALQALVAPATAEFHVLGRHATFWGDGAPEDDYTLIATPSNRQNCDNWEGSHICMDNYNDNQLPSSGVFSIKAGFCGESKMNFYRRNGGVWEFYREKDGKKLGNCYELNNSATCQRFGYYFSILDHMFCENIC